MLELNLQYKIWLQAHKVGQLRLKSMSTYVVSLGIAHISLKSCIYGLKQEALHYESP